MACLVKGSGVNWACLAVSFASPVVVLEWPERNKGVL